MMCKVLTGPASSRGSFARLRSMAFSLYRRRRAETYTAKEPIAMNAFLLISSIALWLTVLFLGFLLLGALRAFGILKWQLEQLQATTPSRLGRDGPRLGKKAPAFTLPSTNGKEVALGDYAGRKVLLVFTQSGCSPCKAIVPELNRLAQRRTHQVLVVNNAEL